MSIEGHKRGGARKGAGRKAKSAKKEQVMLTLSPGNAQLLNKMGKEKNPLVDGLLDAYFEGKK